MILCITIEVAGEQFATVLNGQAINVSRHKDYSLFHWKAYDVKALKTPIDKFVFLDALGTLQEVIEAPQLKTRGVNFATAKRSSLELTDEEALQIAHALELVQSGPVSGQATTTASGQDVAADEPRPTDSDDPASDDATGGEGGFGAPNSMTQESAADHLAGIDSEAVSEGVSDATAHARAKKRKRR